MSGWPGAVGCLLKIQGGGLIRGRGVGGGAGKRLPGGMGGLISLVVRSPHSHQVWIRKENPSLVSRTLKST